MTNQFQDSGLPRGPLLDWSSFEIVDAPGISSVDQLPHIAYTTSGRAGIYQALQQLELAPESVVLVPTYHCPTMVAPAILAGLTVAFFGVRTDGLPDLATIDFETSLKCKAIIVPHYFGLAQSLAEVRSWCDERHITLIEDCAHCYFGQAGDRPVGAWGDFATASLAKFFPVAEGGLLASARQPLVKPTLSNPGIKAQIKGWIDVFELATKYKRFAGFNRALSWVFKLKNSRMGAAANAEALLDPTVDSMMNECDMARVGQEPTIAATVLKKILPRGRVIARRQHNFAIYARHFSDVYGAKPLFPTDDASRSKIAPYVFPLWVDDADRVYHAMRAEELPVFRWDRIWPGTPKLAGDAGPQWSRHVLQLLCHQDLSEADVNRTCRATLSLLNTNQ